jgi:hypothetical protein
MALLDRERYIKEKQAEDQALASQPAPPVVAAPEVAKKKVKKDSNAPKKPMTPFFTFL